MSCSGATDIRIVTLNVNGLKQSCQKVWDAKYDAANVLHLLEHLDCDIACFQEVKLSVADYAEFARLVTASGWDAYFSFTRTFQGYSGVATFCRAALSPRAAEEGLLGVAPPQNAAAAAADAVATAAAAAAAAAAGLSCHADMAAEGGGGAAAAAVALSDIAAPWVSDIPFPPAQLATLVTAEEAAHLDGQGRCVVTDHGLFVLLNAYLPACSNVIEQNRRAQFKMKCAMCRALAARLRCLLAAGRHVLLAGDLNCLAWPQDCAAFAAAPHAQQVRLRLGACFQGLRLLPCV
ncbi:Endonuclease/exonuclease/phosphatase [Scenedesmus sp. NREL 46B-D3]|nr:Endonuclease/exonuclease/phosphatase [Scenedesmus sp. NREL 46B-D3]